MTTPETAPVGPAVNTTGLGAGHTARPRLPLAAKASLALTCFTALAAFGGAGAALPEATNKAAILGPLQRLPWSDIFFTGITGPRLFLVVIIGLPQLLAAISVLTRHRLSRSAVGVAGAMLTAWIMFGAFTYGIGSEVTGIPVMVLFTLIALAEITTAITWTWRRYSTQRR